MSYPTLTVELALGSDPSAAYKDLAPSQSEVYYRLNEASTGSGTFADSSGNGHTSSATVITQVAGGLSGDSDQATSSPRIQIPDTAALRLGQNFSIVFWFKSAGSFGAMCIRDHANNTGRKQLILNSTNGDIVLNYQGSLLNTWSGVWNADTNWHMYALVMRAGVPYLYFDGVEYTSAASGATVSEVAGTTYVGTDNAGTTTTSGSLDEFAEYNIALPAQYIAALYAAAAVVTPVTWTDITSYVISGNVQRGRQHETDSFEAGTCQLELDNSDGRFDPENTSSPYYPNLRVMRAVRVKFTYNAVTYTRFKGFVERWPVTWRPPGDSIVTITAIDGMEALSRADISGWSWAQELSGARVGHALTAGLWPAADRNVDAGQSQVIAATFAAASGSSALSHIASTADSDLGYFFVDGQGRATFHDRYHRANNATSQATFGDNAGELPYEDITPDYSKDLLANDVTVTRTGGVPQRVTDSQSVRRYFPRTLAKSPAVTSDGEALNQANLLLARYHEPLNRIEVMALNPAAVTGTDGDSLWAQVLGREIGDLVTLVKRPSYGGTITKYVFLERIRDEFSEMRWTSTWQLSPAEQSAPWILGISVLGVSTIPAY